ncbi:MAG: CDGSH iron-sulfur domain-containing protein [Candidatus Omnitrophica bacterium]|nr:CDGSH iron-sulfur domain-containing protein [Candidatus Omnitrophota bacterium]MCB9721864.1 CDGSH iron-sulfur domain-containing protein [Candidatus Omnitrophota bacterium]
MARKKFSQAQNAPFVMTMKPGRYAWCSCGESRKQPFCDGNHEETGMFPVVVHIDHEQEVRWCGCKSSESAPWCDNTHLKFLEGGE